MTKTSYDRARTLGHRVFFEPETDTLRQCPENYLLAARNDDGQWYPCPDKASQINAHSLGLVLDQRQHALSGDNLAEAVEHDFFGTAGSRHVGLYRASFLHLLRQNSVM